MQIEIQLDNLDEDERYHLGIGLHQIKSPSPSCCAAIDELSRIATANFNKFLESHPEARYFS